MVHEGYNSMNHLTHDLTQFASIPWTQPLCHIHIFMLLDIFSTSESLAFRIRIGQYIAHWCPVVVCTPDENSE